MSTVYCNGFQYSLDVLLEESPPTQSHSETFIDEDDYSEQQKEFEKVS